MYMAVQYAFVGIAQTRKTKTHACNNQTATNESTAQNPVFLLEAKSIVAESNGTESVCNAEVVEEIAEKTIATDSKVISEEANPDKEPSTVSAAPASSTYQQGIDDFYQSQAESQKKKLDTIHEYLLYIMSPFIYEEDMDEFCIERRFASLCVTASGEPLSHSTLRNLTVTSNSDQIHCDIQGADGLSFHIPSQLGIEKE